MARRVYTWSAWLAEAARGRIEWVNCVSQEYTWRERRACERIHDPPLINAPWRREPALLVATRRGARPADAGRPPWTTYAPWGDPCPGYCVPVARSGFARGYCRARITAPGTVALVCPGEPSWGAVKLLRRAAERAGARLEVASARLYTMEDARRIARYLAREAERRGTVVVRLPARGLAVLAAAAVAIAVKMGLEPGRDVVVKPLFDPSLGSRERNRLKQAVDYMCGMGDEVACKASKALHAPLWPLLARPGEANSGGAARGGAG